LWACYIFSQKFNMKSSTNTRNWTTVAIGREQYDRLSRAAKVAGRPRKGVINALADSWSNRILGIAPGKVVAK
jgi:hypothetical protein